MVDRNPSRNLKFEVAFTTDPDDPSPVWVDLTSRLDLAAGIMIRRGREDEYEQAQNGAMTLTLNNTDGALTPDNASSTYYPNVLPQRRCRLKYVNPDTAAVTYRFDGYVDEWPVEWPGGTQNYSQSTITATDILSRIGAKRQTLRSVVVETMALDAPAYHFPLGEPDGSTVVSDIVSDEPATLTVTQIGTGGTIEFAAGIGAPTDGIGAPVFTRASATAGLCLDGLLPTPIPAGPVVLEASFASTTDGTIAALYDGWGNYLHIEMVSGVVYGIRGNTAGLVTNIAANNGAHHDDGQTHVVTATMTVSGTTVTVALTIDGAAAGTDTGSTNDFPMVPYTRLMVGAQRSVTQSMFTGTLSHVAVFSAALGTGRALEHYNAQLNGFAGERSDQRIARIASWTDIPAGRLALDTGTSTDIGHLDCSGLSPLEYMRKIETTEAGLLFAGTDGKLTFHNRARSYSSAAPGLSVPSRMLDASTRLAKNLLLVKNDVTGSRVGGATVRMVDQASIDACTRKTETLDVVVGNDAAVADAVAWRLNTSKTPLTRFTQMDLDAYTDGTYSPSILTGVDIGARVEVTGMPSQSPTSTQRQTVQGYAETITHSAWSLSVNATPYAHLVALILDDSTYGTTDSTNHLAY